jgi:hypothetical protein
VADGMYDQVAYGPKPLPHVWLGVSAENQAILRQWRLSDDILV